MLRFCLIGAVLASFLFFGASLVGRAIDTEVQEHIVFTRGGVTLDCERHSYHAGETISYEDGSTAIAREGDTSYENCHAVP